MLKTIAKNSGKQAYVHKKSKCKRVGNQAPNQLRTMHTKTGYKLQKQKQQKTFHH